MMGLLSLEELEHIRTAGRIVRECLLTLSKEAREGVTTKALEKKADDFIKSKGGTPAFLGYKGYPASICTSRNDVVVHGIPKEEEVIKSGDILSVDVGVQHNGYYADAARTFRVGKITDEAKRLMEVTEVALAKGIEKAKSGNYIEDISCAIQDYVESNGFNVVRAFVGHGIGKKIHEGPEVPNFRQSKKGKPLEAGLALAIEPMVNAGESDIKILDDGWTAVTKDGRLSAHFEHTVIVGDDKAEVVT